MITVIGSLNIDLNFTTKYFPKIGETIGSEKFDISYGGKGANQAVAASRYGGDVTFIGAVGDDSYGMNYIKRLENEKVNISSLIELENTSTGLAAIIKSNNDNSIILSHGANYGLSIKHIKAHEKIILESDYILVQFEIPLEVIDYIVNLAYDNKIPIVINPAPYKNFPANWLNKVTYFTPNEVEYSEYKNSSIYKSKYDEKMIITLGSKGASVFSGGKKINITPPVINVVDTTGAGDTFNGVLVTELSRGLNIKEATELAVHAASISTTKIGAQTGMPNEKEVKRIILET